MTPKLTAAGCVLGVLGSVGTLHECYLFWHCCSCTDYILSPLPVRETRVNLALCLASASSLLLRSFTSFSSLVKPTNLHSKWGSLSAVAQVQYWVEVSKQQPVFGPNCPHPTWRPIHSNVVAQPAQTLHKSFKFNSEFIWKIDSEKFMLPHSVAHRACAFHTMPARSSLDTVR